jgi:hypothetical protein
MIHVMFSVYDSKAETYQPPQAYPTAGMAIRSFAAGCNDPQSAFSRWPEDFVLFELGTYDDQTGLMVPHKCPLSRGVAIEFKDAVSAPVETAKEVE